MPNLKWLDDVLPDNDKWNQWRGNLIELRDNVKNNIDIGKTSCTRFFELHSFWMCLDLDPRIAALSEAKYAQFRSWFDQRLDDAVAAAEKVEQQTANSSPKGKWKYTRVVCKSVFFFICSLSTFFTLRLI